MYIYHLRTKIVFQADLLAEVVGVQEAAVPDVVGHDATNRLGHGFTGAPDLDVLEEGGKLAVTLGRVLLLDLLLVPHRIDLVQGDGLWTSLQVVHELVPAEIARQDFNCIKREELDETF